MRTVLRLPVDARVSLLDPAGVEHHGVIDRYERDRAVIRIESSSPSPARPRIILAAAIIKGPRMDFIVEKAAELGASELWPLVCARGLVRSPGAERLARWRRLALAAAKQSQSPSAMEVRVASQSRRLDSQRAAGNASRNLRARRRAAQQRDSTRASACDIDSGRTGGRFRRRRTREDRERGIRRGRTRTKSPQKRDSGSGSGQHSTGVTSRCEGSGEDAETE